MLTVAEVKQYLHIDYADDDLLISTGIQGGYDYLSNAINDFDKLADTNAGFARQAKLWVLTQWMPSFYDEREGMYTDTPTLNYAARSMLTQLQMYEYEEERNND